MISRQIRMACRFKSGFVQVFIEIFIGIHIIPDPLTVNMPPNTLFCKHYFRASLVLLKCDCVGD